MPMATNNRLPVRSGHKFLTNSITIIRIFIRVLGTSGLRFRTSEQWTTVLRTITGVARILILRGRRTKMENFGDVFQWRKYDDGTEMTSQPIFLNFDFIIISLKNHKLAKSCNFRSLTLKIKGRWRLRFPSAW